jgi:hypothetical protein
LLGEAPDQAIGFGLQFHEQTRWSESSHESEALGPEVCEFVIKAPGKGRLRHGTPSLE